MKYLSTLFILLHLLSWSAACQTATSRNITLSKDDRQEILTQAQEKINFIMGNIENLASQPGPESDVFRKREERRKESVVKSILSNFADADSNTVQVTNKARRTKKLSARAYFTNLSHLGRIYSTIEIKTYQRYIGEIRQAGAESYVINSVFCQEFTGTNAKDDRQSFTDVTCKNITLHIKHASTLVTDEKGNSKMKDKWIVQIGDITIDDQQ